MVDQIFADVDTRLTVHEFCAMYTKGDKRVSAHARHRGQPMRQNADN